MNRGRQAANMGLSRRSTQQHEKKAEAPQHAYAFRARAVQSLSEELHNAAAEVACKGPQPPVVCELHTAARLEGDGRAAAPHRRRRPPLGRAPLAGLAAGREHVSRVLLALCTQWGTSIRQCRGGRQLSCRAQGSGCASWISSEPHQMQSYCRNKQEDDSLTAATSPFPL